MKIIFSFFIFIGLLFSEDINQNKTKLNQLKTKRDEIRGKLSQIPGLEQKMKEMKAKIEKVSKSAQKMQEIKARLDKLEHSTSFDNQHEEYMLSAENFKDSLKQHIQKNAVIFNELMDKKESLEMVEQYTSEAVAMLEDMINKPYEKIDYEQARKESEAKAERSKKQAEAKARAEAEENEKREKAKIQATKIGSGGVKSDASCSLNHPTDYDTVKQQKEDEYREQPKEDEYREKGNKEAENEANQHSSQSPNDCKETPKNVAIKNINGNKTCATTNWKNFKEGFNSVFEFDSNKQAYQVKKAEALSSPNCRNGDYVQFFDNSNICQLSNEQISEAINSNYRSLNHPTDYDTVKATKIGSDGEKSNAGSNSPNYSTNYDTVKATKIGSGGEKSNAGSNSPNYSTNYDTVKATKIGSGGEKSYAGSNNYSYDYDTVKQPKEDEYREQGNKEAETYSNDCKEFPRKIAIKHLDGEKCATVVTKLSFQENFNLDFEAVRGKQRTYRVKNQQTDCKVGEQIQFFDANKDCQLSNDQIAEIINFSKNK